jgi:hypothetical protein
MHPSPRNKVVLSENARPHGSPVFIEETKPTEEGSVGEYEIQEARKKIARLTSVAHSAAPYWNQLQQVQTGRCEWEGI